MLLYLSTHFTFVRFLFNDSEVKAFDSSQLAQECFGGEMTSTTYDTIADKFMDFSFERVCII